MKSRARALKVDDETVKGAAVSFDLVVHSAWTRNFTGWITASGHKLPPTLLNVAAELASIPDAKAPTAVPVSD